MSVGVTVTLSQVATPNESMAMWTGGVFFATLALAALGRLTLMREILVMLRLTIMKLARRKNMMSISGTISMRASSSWSLEDGESLTGITR